MIESALAETQDSDARWRYVSTLHGRGDDQTFVAAAELCHSEQPAERILGADILGQLGAADGVAVEDRPYRGRCVEVLLEQVVQESEAVVLEAIAIAFGHLDDVRCVPPLRRLRDHPDLEVRHGVAFGLLGLDDDVAVEILIELSQDEDANVRDWATFGLARQIDRDTPDLQEALLARLTDPDEDTRAEALAGLAQRGDERAIAPVLSELSAAHEPSDPGLLMDALYVLAARTRDSQLCHRVEEAREIWTRAHPDEALPPDLESALNACAERQDLNA